MFNPIDKKNNYELLSEIEMVFTEIKNKKDVNSNLRKLKIILNRLNIHVDTITIIPAEKDQFFGMSIFPPTNVSDRIIDCMIKDKKVDAFVEIWNQNDKWIIEIDSKLLYDNTLNANPKEITAALLHEVGHTIYSNSIPCRLHKLMCLTFVQLPSNVKIILKNNNEAFKSLFSPVVAQACINTSYSTKKEMAADKYVVEMGYGDALHSLICKIMKKYGSDISESVGVAEDKNVMVALNWSSTQAIELRMRKDELRKSINTISLISPSLYIKDTFNRMNKLIFKGAPSFDEVISKRNRGKYVIENTYVLPDDSRGIPCEALIESTNKSKLDKNGKLPKITQHDIDIISIQIDRIENQDDKIYLLDVIYDYMETLDLASSYIELGNKVCVQMTEKQIKDLKTQLINLRTMVLTTKIQEKTYGVFIKYPKGYEG